LQEASQSPAGEAALQRTIRELQAERAGLQARLDTMQAASKSAAHAAVEGELRELEAERATLQEQLEAMQDASRAWEVQRAELHEQQRTAMEAQASLESTVQQLEAEARQQQPQLQDLQRELEGARAAADAKWSCIVQQKDHQLSLLHTKTTQLQQGLRQLQAQHKEEQESLRQQLEVRHQQEQERPKTPREQVRPQAPAEDWEAEKERQRKVLQKGMRMIAADQQKYSARAIGKVADPDNDVPAIWKGLVHKSRSAQGVVVAFTDAQLLSSAPPPATARTTTPPATARTTTPQATARTTPRSVPRPASSRSQTVPAARSTPPAPRSAPRPATRSAPR